MPEQFAVRDRVTCDFYRGEPATVTKLLPDGGFAYTLDTPHELGPRYGAIDGGEAYDTTGWRKLGSPQVGDKGDGNAVT